MSMRFFYALTLFLTLRSVYIKTAVGFFRSSFLIFCLFLFSLNIYFSGVSSIFAFSVFSSSARLLSLSGAPFAELFFSPQTGK